MVIKNQNSQYNSLMDKPHNLKENIIYHKIFNNFRKILNKKKDYKLFMNMP